MKNIKIGVLLIGGLLCDFFLTAQESEFNLFKKSDQTSGFGAVSFNMFQGKYFMMGGEGAAVFSNFYFGGFGHSGFIGNYTYPFGSIAYKLQRGSGGIMIGGISNGDQIFALYTDLKLSWDAYEANAIGFPPGSTTIEYQGFSFVPAIGVALRPISWMQIRLAGGYRYSGLLDDGGLEDVPYSATTFNFQLTFGGF